MRAIAAGAVTQLETGRFGKRTLVRFDLPSGIYGFWDDIYDLQHDGTTYTRAASHFQVAGLPSQIDLQARGVEVRFTGIDAQSGATIEAEDYHQRPVAVALAVLGTTGQILTIVPWFSGVIDQIIREEAAGGDCVVRVLCESYARNYRRRGVSVRNDGDQRRRLSSDAFFSFSVPAKQTPVSWGKQGPNYPGDERRG